MQHTYVIGHSVIVDDKHDNQPLWLLTDGQGSVRETTDFMGIVAAYSYDEQRFYYDAFGNYLSTTADPQTALRFAGEYADPTGLTYLRARYYDPATGRFNRMDPFAGINSDPQSLHKYVYVHGDPVNFIDPTGKWEFTLFGTIHVITLSATMKVGVGVGAGTISVYLANRYVYQPLALMLNSKPIRASRLSRVQVAIIKSWRGQSPRMEELRTALVGGIVDVRVVDSSGHMQGMHFKLGGRTLYISSMALQQNDVAVALVLFAEYQHSQAGGGLSEIEAQREFEAIRSSLPPYLRTEYIEGLYHVR